MKELWLAQDCSRVCGHWESSWAQGEEQPDETALGLVLNTFGSQSHPSGPVDMDLRKIL